MAPGPRSLRRVAERSLKAAQPAIRSRITGRSAAPSGRSSEIVIGRPDLAAATSAAESASARGPGRSAGPARPLADARHIGRGRPPRSICSSARGCVHRPWPRSPGRSRASPSPRRRRGGPAARRPSTSGERQVPIRPLEQVLRSSERGDHPGEPFGRLPGRERPFAGGSRGGHVDRTARPSRAARLTAPSSPRGGEVPGRPARLRRSGRRPPRGPRSRSRPCGPAPGSCR